MSVVSLIVTQHSVIKFHMCRYYRVKLNGFSEKKVELYSTKCSTIVKRASKRNTNSASTFPFVQYALRRWSIIISIALYLVCIMYVCKRSVVPQVREFTTTYL